MPYCLDTFIIPLRPNDVNVRIRDESLAPQYNIRPCTEVSNAVKGKQLISKMKSDSKDIILDFKDEAEARAALIKFKDALEVACTNAKNRGIVGGGSGGTPSPGGEVFTKIFPIASNGETVFVFASLDDVQDVLEIYVNGISYPTWTYSSFANTLTFNPSLYALETTDELKVLYFKNS